MTEKIQFVGRIKELEESQKILLVTDTKVFYFWGEGGIGKTGLLEEIFRRVNNSLNEFYIVPIIDFDDRSILEFDNFEVALAGILESSGVDISGYLRAKNDLRKIKSANVSKEAILAQEEKVLLILVDYINKISISKRVVLFFDTVEKIEKNEFWAQLLDFLSKVKNTACFLSGRKFSNPIVLSKFKDILKNNFIDKALGPLNLNDRKVYFEAKQSAAHTKISSKLSEKLLYLSSGRPILIDLAVEYAARRISLDWLADLEIPKDNKKISRYKKDFERQIISHISHIRKPIHRLILVMTRIYPVNESMIKTLLNISESEAHSLFLEACSYVFIKILPSEKFITLHDELRELINIHIWTELDGSQIRRKRDSALAVQVYKIEVQSLNEKIKLTDPQSIEYEKLEVQLKTVIEQLSYHALYADLNPGFELWKKIIGEQREHKEISFALRLINNARDFYEEFTEDQIFEFLLAEARIINDSGDSETAIRNLEELLKKFGAVENRKSSIYNALAIAEEKTGKLKEALTHQLNCFEIIERTNPKSIPSVANRIGYLYRLLGDRDKAEEYYKFALDFISKTPVELRDQNLKASLLNNLGYIAGLNRKYMEMDSLCEKSADLWKTLGMFKQIGRSEITRGIFNRDQGHYKASIELLNQAILRYEIPDDHEQLCRAYFHLGWSEWYIAEKVNNPLSDISLLEWDEVGLRRALEYLNQSLELARKYGLKYELSGILHQTASVNWYLWRTTIEQNFSQQAKKLNEEAYSTGVATHDLRYAIDSLVGFAEWDYDMAQYDQISFYNEKLNNEFGAFKNQYELYFGRMNRIIADIALQNGDFESAFKNYAIGLAMISDHHGFSRYTIQRELMRLTGKIKKIPPQQTIKWVEYLKGQWSLPTKKQNMGILIDWCKQFDLPGFLD